MSKVTRVSAGLLPGPLPGLDPEGIHWVVAGGESGPGHRGMDRARARRARDLARARGAASFFKQSSGPRPGRGGLLDGRWREFPAAPPADGRPTGPADATEVPGADKVRRRSLPVLSGSDEDAPSRV